MTDYAGIIPVIYHFNNALLAYIRILFELISELAVNFNAYCVQILYTREENIVFPEIGLWKRSNEERWLNKSINCYEWSRDFKFQKFS